MRGHGPRKRSRSLAVNRRTHLDNEIDAVEEDRVRVVAAFGRRLGLRRHIRPAHAVFVVVMMTVWAEVVVVMACRKACMKMRLEAMSDRLIAAMRMAQRCGLG